MSGASAAAIAAYRNNKNEANDQPKVKMTARQKAVVVAIFAVAATISGFIAAN